MPSLRLWGVSVTVRHTRAAAQSSSRAAANRTMRRFVGGGGSGGSFGIVPRIPDSLAFVEHNQILLLVHQSSDVQVDLSLAWLPFEEHALERSLSVAFHGVTIRICHPEDIVVYKLVAARPLGLEDARQLTLLHHHTIDRRRASEALREFDEVLEDGRPRLPLWHEIARSAYPA